jgi:regulator of replication initiation timing
MSSHIEILQGRIADLESEIVKLLNNNDRLSTDNNRLYDRLDDLLEESNRQQLTIQNYVRQIESSRELIKEAYMKIGVLKGQLALGIE